MSVVGDGCAGSSRETGSRNDWMKGTRSETETFLVQTGFVDSTGT